MIDRGRQNNFKPLEQAKVSLHNAAMEIYFIRHGETLWNQEGRYQGHKNSPLSQRGSDQVHRLGSFLKERKIQKIYSSPLGRAKQTSEILSASWTADIQFIDELKEIHLGQWEGQLKSEIQEKWPLEFSQFRKSPELFHCPNGESFAQIRKRVARGLQSILRSPHTSPIAVVSHGVAIQSLLSELLNRPISQTWKEKTVHQSSFSIVRFDPSPILVLRDQIPHLEERVASSIGV